MKEIDRRELVVNFQGQPVTIIEKEMVDDLKYPAETSFVPFRVDAFGREVEVMPGTFLFAVYLRANL